VGGCERVATRAVTVLVRVTEPGVYAAVHALCFLVMQPPSRHLQ
jgi:hypothetical protein